jgi:hypothetical protein
MESGRSCRALRTSRKICGTMSDELPAAAKAACQAQEMKV